MSSLSNPRMVRMVGLVLLVLGCASLVRTVLAGRTDRPVVLAIPVAFAVFGFVLLLVSRRLQHQS